LNKCRFSLNVDRRTHATVTRTHTHSATHSSSERSHKYSLFYRDLLISCNRQDVLNSDYTHSRYISASKLEVSFISLCPHTLPHIVPALHRILSSMSDIYMTFRKLALLPSSGDYHYMPTERIIGIVFYLVFTS
jgi:hypothetical protein